MPIVSALLPLYFVFALGYVAGRRHQFQPDQASGFNALLTGYALPAMLFTTLVGISRAQLTRAAAVFAVVLVAYMALFGVAFAASRRLFRRTTAEAALAALCVASPSVPFFGPAVLTPLFGAGSATSIATAAIVVNVFQVPLAVVLLRAGPPHGPGTGRAIAPGGHASASVPARAVSTSVVSTVVHAILTPIVVAPVGAVIVVLLGVSLPQVFGPMLTLIGSATSGVAMFSSGLTVAAHRLQLSREVVVNGAGKLLLLPALVAAAGLGVHLAPRPLEGAVVTSALPTGLIALILASRYNTYVSEAASMLLLTSVALVVALPLWTAVGARLTGR